MTNNKLSDLIETKTELELKELMLNDRFTNLQNLVNEEVNLMDILKVSHKELQHSNFLAWIFNPQESHNLGDLALKEFIKIYFKQNKHQNLGNSSGLSVFDFVLLDFSDLKVRREYKNIDLILISNKNKFCLVIENKIYSNERGGQLKKYRERIENELGEYKYRIYIYLSLHDQEISYDERNNYVQLNYGHVVKFLEQIVNSKNPPLAEKTQFVLEQYMQTLKFLLNMNTEIEDIAKDLYRQYKSAFDLVFKYALTSDDNETNAISSKISSLISSQSTIKPFVSNKTYRRFQPNFLYDNRDELIKQGLVMPDDDLTNNWIYLFEFNIRKDRVNFDFKIGSGNQQIREKLHNIYKKYPEIFNTGLNKNLSAQWHLVFQKEILKKIEIESYFSDDESEKLLTDNFNSLIKNDVSKIILCLKNEISSNTSSQQTTNSN